MSSRVLERLEEARAAGPELASLAPARRLDAWSETVDELLAGVSASLAAALLDSTGLSPPGLRAALATMLGGVGRAAAARVFEAVDAAGTSDEVDLVVLASNIPALAVQPLLSALAAGRPLLLKSSTAEPFFTPAFVAALARREPILGRAFAAVDWPGGDRAVEDRVLPRVGRVLAYGSGETIRDLRERCGERLVAYGPKLSLAIVSGQQGSAAAAGLARDTALFDQRGCLSLQWVFTDGDAAALARRLAAALAEEARRLPPGRIDASAASAVQQARAEAAMRGSPCFHVEAEGVGAGTVLVEPAVVEPQLVPSPGLRLLRVHPVADLEDVPRLLGPWRGFLQGAALAVPAAEEARLRQRLGELGVRRFASPGELQQAGAAWVIAGGGSSEVLFSG